MICCFRRDWSLTVRSVKPRLPILIKQLIDSEPLEAQNEAQVERPDGELADRLTTMIRDAPAKG